MLFALLQETDPIPVTFVPVPASRGPDTWLVWSAQVTCRLPEPPAHTVALVTVGTGNMFIVTDAVFADAQTLLVTTAR